jgi:hypothetical protein
MLDLTPFHLELAIRGLWSESSDSRLELGDDGVGLPCISNLKINGRLRY